MPITPPVTPPAPPRYYASDIVLDAAIEIGVVSPGNEDNFPGDQAQWIFRKLNYMLDVWAAKKAYVYTTNFMVFPLIPNLSPILIGPTGSAGWVIPQRPVRIETAALLLNGSTEEVDCPINIRDDKWWAANQTKSITSSVPTDLYYSANFENGECRFWPVQQNNRNVRLQLWQMLQQYYSLTDPISGPGTQNGTMPPAYRSAMMHTLAELIAPSFEREVSAALQKAATASRTAVFGNNNLSPRIGTRDYGMPNAGRRGGYFNYGYGGPPGLGPR